MLYKKKLYVVKYIKEETMMWIPSKYLLNIKLKLLNEVAFSFRRLLLTKEFF